MVSRVVSRVWRVAVKVVSWAVEGAIEASTVSTLVITHNRHCTTSFSPFNCNITPYMCSNIIIRCQHKTGTVMRHK